MKSPTADNFIILYSILFSLLPEMAFSQIKSIGLPIVENYTTETSHAGTQTWDIIEDKDGIMYFGNNAGIVIFDGEEWEIMPISNGSIVRSLAYGADGKIYAGGYTEIGVLEKDIQGRRVYKSLNHLIPEKYRSFDDIWKIYQTRYGIIFQSFEYIFILNGESLKVIVPTIRFGFSYYVNNNFYITDKGVGLLKLSNGELQTVSEAPVFTNDEIRFILPHRSNDLLIGTFSSGIYVLSTNGIAKWQTKMNRIAMESNLYNGSKAGDQYTFGTVKNGVYFTDKDGNLIQHLNRLRGLQYNTVLSHYTDTRKNIWLGLDNGIDYVKASLPVSFLNYNFNIETVYCSATHNGRLYIGTNQGLFTKPLNEIGDIENIEFEMVENTEGQVWSLYEHNGELLCGHNRGAYRIDGKRAIMISSSRGVWNFFKLHDVEELLFSGTYDGLIAYKLDAFGHWIQAYIVGGLEISSRKIVCDLENNIWISHDYEGLYKVTLNEKMNQAGEIKHFLRNGGLDRSLPYYPHLLDNLFFISTGEGNYVYDNTSNSFVPNESLNSFFKDIDEIIFLKTDSRGNRWYSSNTQMGFFRLLEDGTFTNIFTPFEQIYEYLIDNYEDIYIHDQENIYIGSQKGLIHYSPSAQKDFFQSTSTFIKRVEISSRNIDSSYMFRGNKNLDPKIAWDEYGINYEYNTILFTYTCPDPENYKNISYSYRLKGFSDEWSDWSFANAKQFNNLKDGEYIFEVRAKNIFNNISETDQFSFSIKTPYYRSKLAYFIYFFLFSILTLLSILFLRKRIENIRNHEKAKHTVAFKKKEEQLNEERLKAEREIERLRIERLETNMRHKNKELANSTYYIIRKNKFLNSLKQELSNLSKAAKSEFVEQELKKLSRKIDRDINNEKNWEVFDKYFDEVHQEFFSRVKEKHPELSPKELRLSAYLKMNISTKEIAPLMNISVRGVEISRYRLRKKLKLERDDNLTQYLMEV